MPPPNDHRHLMITPLIFNHPIFFTHKMVNETAISAAIADLKTQAKPNYDATAKKHDIDRNTLRRRFEGKTASRAIAQLESQGLLNNALERVLIERINTFSVRGLPLTPAIVRNLV